MNRRNFLNPLTGRQGSYTLLLIMFLLCALLLGCSETTSYEPPPKGKVQGRIDSFDLNPARISFVGDYNLVEFANTGTPEEIGRGISLCWKGNVVNFSMILCRDEQVRIDPRTVESAKVREKPVASKKEPPFIVQPEATAPVAGLLMCLGVSYFVLRRRRDR